MEDNRFYASNAWRTLRALKLSTNPTCEECHKIGLHVPATEVHHIKERKDFPGLAFDLDNLQSLCRSCHNGKRRKDRHAS